MRRGALVLLLVLAGGGLACPRRGPTVGPTVEPTGDAAKSTGSTPTPTPELSVLPSWTQALFDPTLRRTYAWTYVVDTHDEDGSVAEASGTLRCRTDGPTHHALGEGKVAWVSCQACEFTPGRNDGFEPDFDDCYLATADGLWLVDAPPSAADEARRIVAEPPYLPASPVPRSESHVRDEDGLTYEESLYVSEQETAVRDHQATAWCRTDASTQMYGSRTIRCFAPGLGLTMLEIVGRSGPSIESYPLVDIEPPPPR